MAQPNIWPQQSIARPVGVRRRDSETQALSWRLWSLDWQLPWHFDTGSVEAATLDEALPFIKEHYPSIFGHKDLDGRFLPNAMTEAKRRFFAEMDYFMFRVEGQAAGVAMGHPSDWTSYYVRSAAVLPAFRERGLISHYEAGLVAPLRAAGVERLEAECSPANIPMVKSFASQGWICTGSATTERWGVLLRHTKFLTDEARATFMRQYTAMPFARRRASDNQ